jgi:hypothetical protein
VLVAKLIRKPLLVLAALALVASACSGGNDDGATLEAVEEPTPTPLPVQDTPEQPTEEPVDAEPTVDAGDAAVDLEANGDRPGTDDPASSATPDPDIDLSKPAFTEASKVSTVGLDEVFFGMTAADAAAAAATAWTTDGSVTSQCWFADPVNGPVGVSFMMWNGGVERVDVTTELITTRSGAGVGSTPEELRELFGALLDESDPAVLAFVPTDEGDANFRIFFEVSDGAVSSYRAGRLPMVEFPACP